MEECIFCRIVNGEILSARVADTERSLAFMDIMPARKGHILVIPKKHAEIITGLNHADLQDIIIVAQRVADAMFKALKCDGVNIHQCNRSAAGQVVNHVHFHLIPREEGDNLNFGWSHE
ncbi:MAG: HIT family protein, partial [Candidatus Auribacterota bacterium]|nr:HIT family protein [Candidatus Auribacterota bacterium]